MTLLHEVKSLIKGRKLKIVLPEGDDPRIAGAARELSANELADPVVFGPLPPAGEAEIAAMIAQRPKLKPALAGRLLAKPLYRAGALVATGGAAAMLAGAANPTARVIEAALMTIGLAPGVALPSSFFLMPLADRALIFADCAVTVQPSAGQLAAIAVASGRTAGRLLPEPPRVALLSFSTRGSGQHADQEKVAEATRLAQAAAADLAIDGELQGDAALSPEVAQRKLDAPGAVAGRANVLVFPDLDAGNIAYKLVQQLCGVRPVGPILQGFAKPVSDVSRGAGVAEIVDTAALLLAMSVR